MRIQTLSGKATQVRHSSSVYGSGNQDSFSINTRQITTFRIGVRPVNVTCFQVVNIEEGDDVKVAGKIKKGVFHAYAYNNITTGAKGNIGLALYIISLALLSILGVPRLFGLLFGIFDALTTWEFSMFLFSIFLLLPNVVILIPLTIGIIMLTFETVYLYKSIQAVG